MNKVKKVKVFFEDGTARTLNQDAIVMFLENDAKDLMAYMMDLEHEIVLDMLKATIKAIELNVGVIEGTK